MVSRYAYSNNQSKYTVDGKTSTFTEVGKLLRKRGIDLDNNRFLILQGEVEQIAMMQPKVRRGCLGEGVARWWWGCATNGGRCVSCACWKPLP